MVLSHPRIWLRGITSRLLQGEHTSGAITCLLRKLPSEFSVQQTHSFPSAESFFPTIKSGFRKPSNREYRDLLDMDSEGLMGEEFSTEIGSTVKLQRICELMGDMNSLPRPAIDSRMEALNDEVNTQMFLGKLQEWQNSTPENVKNQGMLGLHRLQTNPRS